jgi:hypothetical protein
MGLNTTGLSQKAGLQNLSSEVQEEIVLQWDTETDWDNIKQ